jgi:hypothetical protein
LNPRSLRLELAPSAGLAIALVALHAAAAACFLAVLPAFPGFVGALPVFGAGLWSAWSRALLRAPSSVRSLQVAGEALELGLADGRHVVAEPAQRRYVGRFLVLVPVRRPVRRTIVVTRDMLGDESFRRLRVWALWGKLPAVSRADVPPVARPQLPA